MGKLQMEASKLYAFNTTMTFLPEWEESLVESGDHGESQEGKSYNWDHQRNCQKI